jgi:hypothetical protein
VVKKPSALFFEREKSKDVQYVLYINLSRFILLLIFLLQKKNSLLKQNKKKKEQKGQFNSDGSNEEWRSKDPVVDNILSYSPPHIVTNSKKKRKVKKIQPCVK